MSYKSILDGNTVPSSSDPSSLSTKLTSKPTSHKSAEQGRRNHINTALQELQNLVSPNRNTTTDVNPERGDYTNISKAAQIESAVGYIKHLNANLSARGDQLRTYSVVGPTKPFSEAQTSWNDIYMPSGPSGASIFNLGSRPFVQRPKTTSDCIPLPTAVSLNEMA
ncbi:uncharacterized protein M421DRAFT_427152 [Didymella exigua CBS 183.55]|uniref:BHLH domain-containing protein n=1 Tax=Didymella exigua CBS 183.55 TaxID=1150837 RepID=A0A6A5R4X4_9PLEO|nr:uncharacterized protein M421DRAFT_427152 [Didymella exigua CBS 183.55]KAF1922220.1 hypothetical protein M421DRAFT_427152 [Didymella exigua CBS 183.55]